MKFSITIPAYKKRFLREAIESVKAQTWPDWELIIVDDCSPEDLASVVEPFLSDRRISYHRNEQNCGAVDVVDNWNRCLSMCSGQYVVCMGDDDRLLPVCLEAYCRLMEQHPGLCVYHIRTQLIDHNGQLLARQEERPEWESAVSLIWNRWDHRNMQFIGDFCYDTAWLKASGGYHKLPLAWGSDDLTAVRAAKVHGIANSNVLGFEYRVSPITISNTKSHALTKMDATMVVYRLLSRLTEELKSTDLRADDRRLMDSLDDVKRRYFLQSLGKNVIDYVGGNPLRMAVCRRKLKDMHFSATTYLHWYFSSAYHRLRAIF